MTLIEGYEELVASPSRPGVLPQTLYYCPELMLDAGRSQLAVVDRASRARGVDTVQLGRDGVREGGLPRGARRLPRRRGLGDPRLRRPGGRDPTR